jgi:hypothetical protein
MNTEQRSVDREIHDFYIAKINNLVREGRESLIASLLADNPELTCRSAESIDRAA